MMGPPRLMPRRPAAERGYSTRTARCRLLAANAPRAVGPSVLSETGRRVPIRAVYHKDCLTSSSCPSCGQPLLGGQDAHALPIAFEQTERERPTSVTIVGRLTYLGVPLGVITALAGVGRSSDSGWHRDDRGRSADGGPVRCGRVRVHAWQGVGSAVLSVGDASWPRSRTPGWRERRLAVRIQLVAIRGRTGGVLCLCARPYTAEGECFLQAGSTSQCRQSRLTWA